MNTCNVTIGKDCEDIITNYVWGLEHWDKQKELNREIKSFNWREFKYRNWCACWEKYCGVVQVNERVPQVYHWN